VKPTEQNAKKPSTKTGLFATLRAFLSISGNAATSAALATALVTLGFLGLAAATASAFVTHEYIPGISEQISRGAPAEGPKDEPVPVPGALEELTGLTVAAGELYTQNFKPGPVSTLNKFDAATGAFTEQFPQASFVGVAVAKSTEDVYVGGFGNNGSVEVFNTLGVQQGPKWTGAGTPSKGFGCFGCDPNNAVAVDNSAGLGDWAAGDVYVADPTNHVVDVFEPGSTEKYVTQLTGISPTKAFNAPSQVAVSEFDGEVIIQDGNAAYLFKPGVIPDQYEFISELKPPDGFKQNVYLAVDGTTGEIYASTSGLVYEFGAAGAYEGQFSTRAGNSITPVAVDPAAPHYVYVGHSKPAGVEVFSPDIVLPDVTTAPVSNVKPVSDGTVNATLNGTVNPDEAGEATCRFAWGTTKEFGNVAPCEPESVPNGGSPVPVHAALSHLEPDTTYYVRLQATNEANGHTNFGEAAEDQEFTTPGPGIHSESVSSVTADSATLQAAIDPNNVATSYYFQYSTSSTTGCDANPSSCTSSPAAPGEPLGLGKGDVEVRPLHLQGLAANTIYHYRVVAVSEPEGVALTVEGEDHTFTTQRPGSPLALPDGRQWEMVSPPNKLGANLLPINGFGGRSGIQASATGDAIAYEATAAPELHAHGTLLSSQVLSVRGPAGWRSQDIDTPHDHPLHAIVGGPEQVIFSEDLSHSVLRPWGDFEQALSAEASAQTLYLHTVFSDGDVNDSCVESCYRPLLTGCPAQGEACAPIVEENADVPPGTIFAPEVDGKCEQPYCGQEPEGATPDLSHVVIVYGGLSEWSADKPPAERLRQVSVLPDGEPSSGFLGSGFGSTRQARHAISDDGSRVVWSAPGGLYMRYNAFEPSSPVNGGGECTVVGDACTVRLDAALGGSSEPVFQIASADDSRVFFTDKGSLYECVMVEEAGRLRCDLSDLTPSGGAVSLVLGASEDGSWVYFQGDGNLYVGHGGTTKLVAVGAPDTGTNGTNLEELDARVSPNGEWLAFMSARSLTGYDNRDAASGQPDEEVYLYDGRTERLVCASCDPTGARPTGMEFRDGVVGRLTDGAGTWSERWVAASIPGWASVGTEEGAFHQPRYLSDSGRLFFDSSDALVPQDVNGTEDVYEYEPLGVPEGAHACTSSSATYSERSGGCVGLISSGTSPEESGFMDASESGGDVFFLTAAKLSPQDYDTSLDLYDARECTSASPCFPVPAGQPPACDTEASCKAAPTPQPAIFGDPSSATFSGAGNITPASTAATTNRTTKCRKPKKLSRGKCVQAKSRHRKKAKKANDHRRAK
jgi:hypothetical protein